MPKHAIKGVPDIILIKGGIFVGLEAKRPGVKQSPEQLEFERLTKVNGAQYHIVHSIDDVRRLGL